MIFICFHAPKFFLIWFFLYEQTTFLGLCTFAVYEEVVDYDITFADTSDKSNNHSGVHPRSESRNLSAHFLQVTGAGACGGLVHAV